MFSVAEDDQSRFFRPTLLLSIKYVTKSSTFDNTWSLAELHCLRLADPEMLKVEGDNVSALSLFIANAHSELQGGPKSKPLSRINIKSY